MRGTFVLVPPTGNATSIERNEHSLEYLQEKVGGYIEIVPMFDTVSIEGVKMKCVAFCNEEGKLHNLPPNPMAQQLWEEAVGHEIENDYLVGNILIVTGDDEFMQSL